MRRLTVISALFLAACGGGAAQTPTPSANTSWIPAGFTQSVSEPSVAYRHADHATCTFGHCQAYEFIARDGCPGGLYVELSTLDATGTVVGMTNDTVGRILPGGKADLTFDILEDSATQTRFSRINCQ